METGHVLSALFARRKNSTLGPPWCPWTILQIQNNITKNTWYARHELSEPDQRDTWETPHLQPLPRGTRTPQQVVYHVARDGGGRTSQVPLACSILAGPQYGRNDGWWQ